MLVIRAGIIRIANREDPDQTAIWVYTVCKSLNTFLFLFSNKMLVIRADIVTGKTLIRLFLHPSIYIYFLFCLI